MFNEQGIVTDTETHYDVEIGMFAFKNLGLKNWVAKRLMSASSVKLQFVGTPISVLSTAPVLQPTT